MRHVLDALKNYGLLLLLKKSVRLIAREGLAGIRRKVDEGDAYGAWVRDNALTAADRHRLQQELDALDDQPLISILVPVYDTQPRYLRECLDSVLSQTYPNWELCIADDASTAPHVRDILEEFRQKDARIKVAYREVNGHISAASNTALALATGDYVALLDHDDLLAEEALHAVVSLLDRHRDADMIYTDEDKIDDQGRRFQPFFKPDWSPDLLLSQMYTCHLGVYRKALVDDIGGFREGYEGSQDHDLVLRLTERTNRIFHIPKVLYHWRSFGDSSAMDVSAKDYASVAGLKAVEDALSRRREQSTVTMVSNQPGCYKVNYMLRSQPAVSIIIPTRDQPALLRACIDSIMRQSRYPNLEFVIVDNGSVDPATLALFDELQSRFAETLKVIRMDAPFNYSAINNAAAELADGRFLLFLNDDTELITADWLEQMVPQAARASIGAVGAKLLYPDGQIQHAGIVVGVTGVAGHGHQYFRKNSLGYHRRLVVNANYAAVTGACMMLQKSRFIEAGGFDEALALAYNDVDLCLRLVDQGYYNLLLPDVQLIHHESKSRGYEDSALKQARFQRETAIIQRRWAKYLENDPFYNPNLTRKKVDFSIRTRAEPL